MRAVGRLFVTGLGGHLGRELGRQAPAAEWELSGVTGRGSSSSVSARVPVPGKTRSLERWTRRAAAAAVAAATARVPSTLTLASFIR